MSMYTPDHHQLMDLDTIHDAIATRPFATLIADQPSLRVAHVPLLIDRQAGPRGSLTGHVAAADPIAGSVRAGAPLLIAFTGPVSYVSPRWYHEPGLPTYDFVAVHVTGRPRAIADPEEILAHLLELTAHHERNASRPWRPDEEALRCARALLPELQAFRVPIDRIEAKLKISQERSPRDRRGVVAGLRAAAAEEARAAAELVAQVGTVAHPTAEGR